INADKLRLRRCRIKQVCDSSAPSGSAKNLVKGANHAVDNKRVSGQSQTRILCYPRLSAFIGGYVFSSYAAVSALRGNRRPSTESSISLRGSRVAQVDNAGRKKQIAVRPPMRISCGHVRPDTPAALMK